MIFFITLLLFSGCNPEKVSTTAFIKSTITQTNTVIPIPTSTLITKINPIPSPAPSLTPIPEADTIFFSGTLITMEEEFPAAEAIAIRNGLILAVGSNKDMLAFQGEKTKLIDLEGQTLMPGFIDGHTHLLTFYGRQDKTLEDAQEIALAHGFTTVSEMWANEDVVESFFQAEQAGILRIRVNIFPSYNDGILDENRKSILLKTWYPAHKPILDSDKLVRIPGIKIFVDGDNASYERGCWALSEPFLPGAGVLNRGVCGSKNGDLYWDQDELNLVVKKAQDAGYRVAFHAMGDLGIETAINAIEYALSGESNVIFRHQIEHNSLARPDLLTRYQSLEIAATVRGNAEVCDLSTLVPSFGEERKSWYVNRYEIPNLGTHAFIETDFGWRIDPNERFDQRTLDPFMHLYGLVTHRYASIDGTYCEPDPIAAEKVISVQRALEMMTIEGAWAVSMEDYIGSLKVGKKADLIVISGNPLTIDPQEIKDLTVQLTMVSGKVEYCVENQAGICSQESDSVNNMESNLPKSGNLALNQKVSASSSGQGSPINAVDGKESTFWGAGDFAPQWIEVDIGAPGNITEIRLKVGQSPNGETKHRILAGITKNNLSEIYQFNQFTQDGEWLIFIPDKPLVDIQFIRVETISSPSWIAWFEIQVLGTR